jgi:hypothetical protein
MTYQRCDRILYKTTIISEPVVENGVHRDSASRPQTRVSQFLTFWPSPSRTLPDSSTPKHLAVVSGTLEARTFDLMAQSFLDKHANDEDPRFGRSNTISPPPTAPLPVAHARRSTASSPNERPHSASISKWRFLPAFLSPTSPQSNAVLEHPGSQVPSTHTKGDIVCLGYNTLDDHGMRRLEGRSDHRPVIGTYVISL